MMLDSLIGFRKYSTFKKLAKRQGPWVCVYWKVQFLSNGFDQLPTPSRSFADNQYYLSHIYNPWKRAPKLLMLLVLFTH